jgi:Ca2+-binding EF-hand superfamily protein
VMRKFSILGIGALALAVMAWPGAARAQAQGDLPGPIDSLQDLQDTGKMLFKMADTNNDGQISQQEAVNAAYQMVGGPFFRADQNGDGALSQDELRAAREAFMNQRPMVRMILQRMMSQPGQTNAPNQGQARQNAMSLIDTNNDGKIEATELRQVVTTGVQSGFASADTNRDGQLSPAEVNAAMIGAARAAAQAAFQRADTDNNGQLSQAEFTQALVGPTTALFRAIDLNNDGQLSPQEAQAAQRAIASQLQRLALPDAPNSPRRMIESGRTPAQGTPVPTFGTPTQPGPAGFVQPTPVPTPVPAAVPGTTPVPVPVQPR